MKLDARLSKIPHGALGVSYADYRQPDGDEDEEPEEKTSSVTSVASLLQMSVQNALEPV